MLDSEGEVSYMFMSQWLHGTRNERNERNERKEGRQIALKGILL